MSKKMRVAGSAMMQAERAVLRRAAEKALAARRARGETLTYELEGWVVQEHPDGCIERLAPIDWFRDEDSPYPQFMPPAH